MLSVADGGKAMNKMHYNEEVLKKFKEMLMPHEMMAQYKKTLKEQTPFWIRQRRDKKDKRKLPSDRYIEARQFREEYRQPKGIVSEMYRQAIDRDTL